MIYQHKVSITQKKNENVLLKIVRKYLFRVNWKVVWKKILL